MNTKFILTIINILFFSLSFILLLTMLVIIAFGGNNDLFLEKQALRIFEETGENMTFAKVRLSFYYRMVLAIIPVALSIFLSLKYKKTEQANYFVLSLLLFFFSLYSFVFILKIV